jgi:WD40 repeat protein/energy-coupling factor transporter ATP-binding protein EcfA2
MAKYALVIGIARYNSPLGNLSKTVGDATAVAEVLKQYGDYQDVQLLTGEVRSAKLIEALKTFLEKQAVRGEALIYFTGHGITVTNEFGEEAGFLATSDCQLKTEGNKIISQVGSIALESVNNLIAKSDLSSLVVIFDCCHSGNFIEDNLVKQSLGIFTGRQDYYLISACRGFEEAYARKSDQHSIFTGAMLRGLSAENAGNDRHVSVDSLFDHIANELKGSGQEPIRMGIGRSLRLVSYSHGESVSPVIDETCPYQGLESFQKEQSRFFFGRKQVIDKLVERLKETNFIPLIGASGSGKSSVIRAGLIPELEKKGWKVLKPIMPGLQPLAELRGALIDDLFDRQEVKEIYSLLNNSGLPALISELPSNQRILLLIDQFEEIFTLCSKEKEKQRQRFIELITQVAEVPTSPLAIITTMRADFLEPCLNYHDLTQLIEDQAIYMPRLTGANLEQAIEEPAKLQGYQLESGLLGEIFQDLGTQNECLPLLQFALTELWQKRDGKRHLLTVEEYRVMGGVVGALDSHAEKFYNYKNFWEESPEKVRSPQEQQWIKKILLKLVRTDEGVKDTRHRQAKSKLLAFAVEIKDRQLSDKQLSDRQLLDKQILETILDELIDSRLLIAGQDNQQGEAWVDLAHEALMEGWQRFSQWRQENRELRRLRERLDDAFREWQKNPREENLMMGGLLAQVQENWTDLEIDLDEATQDFYNQSYAYEIEKSTAFRELFKSRLEEQAQKVMELLPHTPLDALMGAIQLVGDNLQKSPYEILPSVHKSLSQTLEASREIIHYQGHEDAIKSLAFSPNGQMIVSGSADNTIRLWDINGHPIVDPKSSFIGHNGYIYSVVFSPDGQIIASASADSTIRLWDLKGNSIGKPFQGHEGTVYSLAFSPDGQKIISGSWDKTLRLWNVNGTPIGQPFVGHKRSVHGVAFSPDGQKIISGSGDKTLRLWNLNGTPIGQPFRGHNGHITSVVFSPDGKLIISGSSDNTVRIWDWQGKSMGETFNRHEGDVTCVAISPDGQTIVSGSFDNTLRFSNIGGEEIGKPLYGHEDSIYTVAFSPDGKKVASGGWDNSLRLWDVSVFSHEDQDSTSLLQIACQRLVNHYVFKNPQTSEQKAACEICRKLVDS